MTDIKQLPENLKELEQNAAFKSVYKKHTVEQLQELLIEAETDYLSDDNKAALVWRYMNAKGMSFDDVATNGQDDAQKAPTEPNDDQKDVINDDKPSTPTTQEITDYAEIILPAPQGDNSQHSTNGDYAEQPTVTDDQAHSVEVKENEPADTQTEEQTEMPVPTDSNSLPTIDSSGEDRSSTSNDPASETLSGDQGLVTEPPATNTPAPEAEREFVEVTHNGAYNFYETATGTMVLARQATKIYTTATIDKEHILRNINQYNQTRGNLLQITD